MNSRQNQVAWAPPPGFVAVPSKVRGIEVYAPAPEQAPGPEALTFRCPRCSGLTAYNPGDQHLTCRHCGYEQEIGSAVVGLSADRFEFTLQTLRQSERGWGIARRSIHCAACSAVFTGAEGELSTTCPFCGSNRVSTQAAMHDFVRPGYLIPFALDRDQSEALVRTWLGKGWMHPPQLRQVNVGHDLMGIYLPFWIFDARINAHWRARVGHPETQRHYRDGKWETETEIRWRWENGDVALSIGNMLICGSDKLSQVLQERLFPFDLSALTTYDPSYLAGWRAQAYDVALKPAWEVGKQRMRERAKEACYRDISSSHVRDFSMTADLNEERWRYVLLPVYLATYRYGDKVYHVMANGQTGIIAGQKPVDWARVWLAILAVLAPAILGGVLGLITMSLGIGPVILLVASILFVVGLVVSGYILVRASAADDI